MTAEAALGHSLYVIDTMEAKVEQVIRQLPLRGTDGRYLVDDEQLRTVTLSAQSASKAFWKLACAARAEIVRRISERTSDSTEIARTIAREAAEQGVSPRILRRDAAVGAAFGPLFTEQDTAPDLSKEYYTIALRSPDPPAALALAQQRKDQNPFYSTSDFEAEMARARMADPATGYGPSSAGCCGLVYVEPYWDAGVLEATEKVLGMPLRRWLLPDAVVLLKAPPRALDLGCRVLTAHDLHYQQCVFLPRAPYLDGTVWHCNELLLIATRGHLRLPDTLPGVWRDPKIERCIDLYFAFALPKLVVYPRRGMTLDDGWVTVDSLPDHIR